jgi:hypothetical protein
MLLWVGIRSEDKGTQYRGAVSEWPTTLELIRLRSGRVTRQGTCTTTPHIVPDGHTYLLSVCARVKLCSCKANTEHQVFKRVALPIRSF